VEPDEPILTEPTPSTALGLTAPTPPLRVGLAGLGRFGGLHASVLASLPGVELTALADPDPQRLRQAGILVRSMAAKPLIDGSLRVSIGTTEQMQRFWAVYLQAY